MRATVLFAGAGGSTLGVEAAGYTAVGYDYWQPAVDTSAANGLVCHLHDLSDPAGDHLLAPCDLLWASPPCQPFSAAGTRDGEFDDRDGFPWTLRMVEALAPQVVVIENVKGLTFTVHHAYFATILDDLRSLGYDVAWRVLNSADYGVPQTRERCFIIGRRDGGPITWPMPTHTEQPGMLTAPWVSMADALGWSGALLDPNADRGVGMRERHGDRPLVPMDGPAPSMTTRPDTRWRWMLNTGRRWQKGGTREDAQTIDLDHPGPTVTAVADRWWWTRPATTIAGDHRIQPGGHHQPGQQSQNAIRVTTEELAALQDFPPDFIWTGTKTDQARQIGNAVPPTVARVLAAANRPRL